jgi:DNA-binding MarR family transcriptional regulator
MLTRRSVMSRYWTRDVTLMFPRFSPRKNEQDHAGKENTDVARLFFDSFSNRVSSVEASLKSMSAEVEKLKISIDRNQLSDLVLLERLQKAEGFVRESLVLAKQAVEVSREVKEVSVTNVVPSAIKDEPAIGLVRLEVDEAALSRRVLAPTGDLGSLSSITTPTELQVLTMLANEGPKSAPEIGRIVGRSREHTARLMKRLFEEGYIRRDQTRIPFRYSLIERLKQSLIKQESKVAEKEAISVPQT